MLFNFHDIAISRADAEAVVGRITEDYLRQLSAQAYYGSRGSLRLDGGNLELAMAVAGKRFRAAQTSCAGKTELNETAASFHQLALKYAPDFAGSLRWLEG